MLGLRTARRRERERRLAALRRFATDRGWSVVGLVADLRHWPVAPLGGAWSAQAELAVAGGWDDATATVASVLVRRSPPTARSGQSGRGEDAVLLTTLRVASTAAFCAVRDRRLEVTASDGGPPPAVLHELRAAETADRLRLGESLALWAGELAHVGPDRGDDGQDLVRRLDLLGTLAQALQPARG